MVDMARTEIAPAVESYALEIARTAAAKKALDEEILCRYESAFVKKLTALTNGIAAKTDELESALLALNAIEEIGAEAAAIRDTILPKMSELRLVADEAERATAKKYWPFPTYGDLLFSVN